MLECVQLDFSLVFVLTEMLNIVQIDANSEFTYANPHLSFFLLLKFLELEIQQVFVLFVFSKYIFYKSFIGPRNKVVFSFFLIFFEFILTIFKHLPNRKSNKFLLQIIQNKQKKWEKIQFFNVVLLGANEHEKASNFTQYHLHLSHLSHTTLNAHQQFL